MPDETDYPLYTGNYEMEDVEGVVEDKICPICIDVPKDAIILECGHIYCRNCIELWLKPGQEICAYCRNQVARK
jgi:hypothetical protein